MNPSSSSMAPVLADYHKKTANLRSKILKSEEERIQLEQKLHSLSNIDTRLKKQQQIEYIQSYFTKLNEESQRATQRNLNLLNDLTQAEHNLNQLRIDTEQLIRLKHDYLQYLESSHSNQQKIDGNFRYNTSTIHQSDNNNNNNNNSSLLYKNYEDQLKINLDRTTNSEIKDDQSISDTTSNTFSRSKRSGSLRMELHRSGLYFLFDYIEKELNHIIDKKKFYRHDPPTITQTRTIIDIANEQQQYGLKDLDPTTTSMVIFDQLPSIIRRTTIKKCLLTEDILSLNIKDLDKDIITKMLPEQDRSLWIRLIDHFIRLLKLHIMSSQTLANKFAPILLPNNSIYLYDKAKSLLKHILEKIVGIQQSSSDDDTLTDKKQSIQQHIIKTNTPPATTTPRSTSSWLNKLTSGRGIIDNDDDFDTSSSSSSMMTKSKKSIKSITSASTIPRTDVNRDDSDLEFYS
ncbi:unnamed protein product [Rotaria sordida]|uniref:Centrosomal protein kizuna n=1 Tax=Rotaria sordida TaxID=392033 RepID=A0A819S6I9_9BILA|nr:unnamed protein product [Rotaria sordida]CAF4064961.1 unnamed protein product [Rotaria sordida]